MSDPQKKERVHFGSLERDAVAYAKRKREEDEEATRGDAAAAEAPGGGGGARLPGADIDLDLIDEVIDDEEDKMLSEEALEARRRAMAEFERKRVARSIAVPTNDAQVKEMLRKHGHPICLFGEDAGDRRSRLRYLLSKQAAGETPAGDGAASARDSADESDSD
ncbi:hypothetical protein H4R21_005151, partial [Coemansia helicoidea]